MEYRRIGKCGSKVSVLGFGSWLTVGGSVEKKTGLNLIKCAYDNGINFFDTADVYTMGRAEKFLGSALKSFRRNDLFIASKCYWPMSDRPNDRGLSRKHIIESVHDSLKRLKTDYIDLYQCHRFDTETPVEETCRVFNTMIEQGKILYWGVSVWSKDQLSEAVTVCEKFNLHKPISEQPQYNLLSREIETNGVMSYCEKQQIGLVVWSPLAQGVLTGKYNKKKIDKHSRLADDQNNSFVKKLASSDNLLKIDKLIAIANEIGVTVSNLSLAWCLRKKIVASAITSATKIEQLKENLKAPGIVIPEEILESIDKIFNTGE